MQVSFTLWITLKNQYKEKKLNKIEKKLPKIMKRMKRVDLQTAIATIITNPNETWKNTINLKPSGPTDYN